MTRKPDGPDGPVLPPSPTNPIDTMRAFYEYSTNKVPNEKTIELMQSAYETARKEVEK